MNASVAMHELVLRVRKEGKDALAAFDREESRIQSLASESINIYSNNALDRLSEISSRAAMACKELYATLQGLVAYLDKEAKALLLLGPAKKAVNEVAELLEWLNDESEIENNFTGSVNGSSMGTLAVRKFAPSVEATMIAKDWARTAGAMAGGTEEDKAYDEYLARLRKQELDDKKVAEEDRSLRQKVLERQSAWREARKSKDKGEDSNRRTRKQFAENTQKVAEITARLESASSPEAYDAIAAELDGLSEKVEVAGELRDFARSEAERIRKNNKEKSELVSHNDTARFGVGAGIAAAALALVLLISLVLVPFAGKSIKYSKANKRLEAGAYDEAASIFMGLEGFRDSETMVSECIYRKAENELKNGEVFDAMDLFSTLGEYRDSTDRISDCCAEALRMVAETTVFDDDFVKEAIRKIPEDIYSGQKVLAYKAAQRCEEEKRHEFAAQLYSFISGYNDSDLAAKYNIALYHYEQGSMDEAFTYLTSGEEMKRYKDSQAYIELCVQYLLGEENEEKIDIVRAKEIYDALAIKTTEDKFFDVFETLTGWQGSFECHYCEVGNKSYDNPVAQGMKLKFYIMGGKVYCGISLEFASTTFKDVEVEYLGTPGCYRAVFVRKSGSDVTLTIDGLGAMVEDSYTGSKNWYGR